MNFRKHGKICNSCRILSMDTAEIVPFKSFRGLKRKPAELKQGVDNGLMFLLSEILKQR